MRLPHADQRALAGLIAGAVLIGFAPIFVRLTDVGYTAAAFWRLALAVPALAALRLPQRKAAPLDRRAAFGLTLAGAFFAADLAVWHQSIRLTSVANATLLANLAPVFVTLASVWLFGERFGRLFLAGLLLALGGAATLVADSLRIGWDTAAGDLCGMTTAVFYAGYILAVSRLRRNVSALDTMLWSTAAAAALLLPLVLALGEPLWPQSLHGWLILLGLALLSHVAGQGLIAYALAHLPAAFSSVSLLVQPLAAAVFAWVLLGERFGGQQAAGGVLVLAGIAGCRLSMTPRASGGLNKGTPGPAR